MPEAKSLIEILKDPSKILSAVAPKEEEKPKEEPKKEEEEENLGPGNIFGDDDDW